MSKHIPNFSSDAECAAWAKDIISKINTHKTNAGNDASYGSSNDYFMSIDKRYDVKETITNVFGNMSKSVDFISKEEFTKSLEESATNSTNINAFDAVKARDSLSWKSYPKEYGYAISLDTGSSKRIMVYANPKICYEILDSAFVKTIEEMNKGKVLYRSKCKGFDPYSKRRLYWYLRSFKYTEEQIDEWIQTKINQVDHDVQIPMTTMDELFILYATQDLEKYCARKYKTNDTKEMVAKLDKDSVAVNAISDVRTAHINHFVVDAGQAVRRYPPIYRVRSIMKDNGMVLMPKSNWEYARPYTQMFSSKGDWISNNEKTDYFIVQSEDFNKIFETQRVDLLKQHWITASQDYVLIEKEYGKSHENTITALELLNDVEQMYKQAFTTSKEYKDKIEFIFFKVEDK